jgi:RimJ/RimL family protein N-acetyltransferase
MILIESERLIFRHQVIEDLDALWSLYCDPEIVKYIPDAPRSREDAKSELEWHMHGHPKYPNLGLWATIFKDTGKLVGRCGLLPWQIDGQLEVEIAYLIRREYWGQGLASEAAKCIMQYGFDQLQIGRLICLIDPDNFASQRVAEKVGMLLEKKVDGIDGDNSPTLIYAIQRGFSSSI